MLAFDYRLRRSKIPAVAFTRREGNMNLAKISALPKTASKEGEVYDLANGAKGQSYRDTDGTLYEYVTLKNGEVRIYRAIEDRFSDPAYLKAEKAVNRAERSTRRKSGYRD